MNRLLIVGDIDNDKSEEVYCSQILARELSADFKIYLAGNFLKIFKLAADVDAILALSSISGGRTSYLSARFWKKKFLIKVDDDYAWWAAIESGKTYFLASDFQKSQKRGRIAALYKRQARLCEKAELVIVPSGFMSEIVNGWGIEKEKIRIAHNPIDIKVTDIAKEEARIKIGISGNLIVSVGPLVSWKGFRMLVKIMPQLISINQFFRLVIVGDGPERKTLKAMIENMGLDKKVYLVGRKNKEELIWFLAASDFFVLNSGHEPFPYHAIEAMAAGVPVVTTAVGANLEVIKQGENGFMVKYNDEFNLIEAIKTLWRMPELREKFIEEGKKIAGLFSGKNMLTEAIKAFLLQ